MKRFTVLFIIFFLLTCLSPAQKYFQQEVNYTILVKLNDVEHSLSAYEKLEYINNSPDDLEFIYFHLWPNAYKNNETALGQQKLKMRGKRKFMNHPEQQGYIDSLDFRVGGKSIRWEFDPIYIDVCKLYLDEPLRSGEKIIISTPFYVKIPKGNVSRLGHIEQSYQITQWYPKPAVYDKLGWHPMPYLNMGEFYSEFGSFDVSVSVPANYLVAATGNIQNDNEKDKILSIVERTEKIKKFDTEDKEFPASDPGYKTLKFKEKNIHDFAWFADKRFHVLKGEVELPHSGRKVNTWAYFPNHEADLWKKAIEYINDAVYYYSLWYGDYPYENCTAVNAPISAGGGMEYPTITVISGSGRDMPLEMVIMHEVGHNWFYGILGSNERAHPWMDEGINTFSEMRYMDAKYPDNKLYKMLSDKERLAQFLGIEQFPYSYMHQVSYRVQARRNLDIPVMSHTDDYADINYGAIAYSKPGLCFYYLKEYLGEDKFNEIMQDYYDNWKFKHPYPEDLQKIIEKHARENLDWFFEDLLNSTRKLDYGIKKVKNNKVLIKNSGQINSPLLIVETAKDSLQSRHWVQGFEGKKWIDLKPEGNTKNVQLFGYKYPELDPGNNYSTATGTFKSTDPLELRLLGAIEKPGKSTINILPVMGWNYYNRFMLGGLFYSNLFPIQKFEYQLMPMYGVGTNDLAGMGKLQFHIHPHSNLFQRITLYVSGKQFAYQKKSRSYYQKLGAGLKFRFARKINKKPVDNDLKLSYIYASDFNQLFLEGKSFNSYFQMQFEHNNKRKLDPYRFVLDLHGNEEFMKVSLDAAYKYVYIYKNSLDIRFLGGAFIHRDNELSPIYNLTTSGKTGWDDYLCDNLYLARFEDPSSQLFITNQFSPEGGGFASYSPFGRSQEYMLALNVASSLPVAKNIPIQLYINTATFGETFTPGDWEKGDSFLYEGGVKLQVIRDVFEFYFPVVVSDDIDKYLDEVTANYWQRIRFTLRLSKLNVFERAKEL